jgi:uncharacterized membrane protein
LEESPKANNDKTNQLLTRAKTDSLQAEPSTGAQIMNVIRDAIPDKARPMSVIEKPHRSVAKALSWRITGTIDTILVSLVVTGKVKVALSIGFVELFTKICLYYIHERAWNKINFGRAKMDYEI